MDFTDFQHSKIILIRHGSDAVFEGEDGSLFSFESGRLTHKENEYDISTDCQWLILYEDGLYIEKLRDDKFLLVIENHQYIGVNLSFLERKLYEWRYIDDIEHSC